MVQDVLHQIEQRDRFVLTSHARPDGDAIGSALACCQVLRAMGKHADVVLHDGVPRVYRSLPFANQVLQADRVSGNYQAAIILECDSIHRTRLQGLENRFLISIDHHVSGRPFADVNWIDPHAVATGEMVFRLAREAGTPFSPEIATCFVHGADDRHRIFHVSGYERAYFCSGARTGDSRGRPFALCA